MRAELARRLIDQKGTLKFSNPGGHAGVSKITNFARLNEKV